MSLRQRLALISSRNAAAEFSRGRKPPVDSDPPTQSPEGATSLLSEQSGVAIAGLDGHASDAPGANAPGFIPSPLRGSGHRSPRHRWVLGGITVAALLIVAVAAVAQRSPLMRREFRPEIVDRGGVPEWTNDERFKSDVFTFVRVRYSSYGGGGFRGGGNWAVDYPDSDLNFSYRLHQLTALEVDPKGKILDLTDEAIFDYPWMYLIEPGRMLLSDAEVAGLRKYLLNGGFLMVDDFWGDYQWQNFYENFKRVFPDREPIELPLEHEIFHCVYDLKMKPQVPSIHSWLNTGETFERGHGGDVQTVHYKGLFDDKGRMMVIICHNTDIGDAWEREGEDPRYFKEFSEKWSYPLGINIVTYAMTH